MKVTTAYWIIGTLATALVALAIYTFAFAPKGPQAPKPMDIIPDVDPNNPPKQA